jgi:protein farnesyltransferase subunit beta
MVVIADILNENEENDTTAAAGASCLYTRTTTTTEQQVQTEIECGQYLNLIAYPTAATTSTNSDHLEYFIRRGLICKQSTGQEDTTTDDDHDDGKNQNRANDERPKYSVRLLRDAHAEYLNTIFRDAPHKLRSSFVSLDSSHTWMIYWCLHGLDLMGQFQKNHTTSTTTTTTPYSHDADVDTNSTNHSRTTQRILRTIQSCFTTTETVSIAQDIVVSDPILSHLLQQQTQPSPSDYPHDISFHNIAGGFGGGPHQLPHAATTYAAVMSLCILASSYSTSSASASNNETNAALEYLLSIRTSLYVFFASLCNPTNGSFRMHLDGEMDVRATYCVYSVLHLLQMIPKSTTQKSSIFTNQQISNYVWSCQSTWEGGFGGEPGAEAHGGYTYCAVAALYLFHQTQRQHGTTSANTAMNGAEICRKLELCSTWLRQRQMSYEGGFSGRINKLVDGCYSFWQGAASVILQEHQKQERVTMTQPNEHNTDGNDDNMYDTIDESDPSILKNSKDPWISTEQGVAAKGVEENFPNESLDCDPFNVYMLKRYILLCTQDENGGLRDKPSKGRDFYHSCYCLSGLSIAQHYGGRHKSSIDSEEDTRIHPTHPCFNIRVEHVAFCQSYFINTQ